MKLDQKLLFTKILFSLSLLLSATSFISNRYGGPSIYPFTYWKLYTQPLGNVSPIDDYRIYAITLNNDTLRIENKGYNYMNNDDYYYFLTLEASKIKEKKYSLSYHKQRIFDFGQFIAPNHLKYLLVKESFDPFEISKDSSKFRKEIILSTP